MKCRECGQEIKFIKMKSGQSMPVDTEPIRISKLSASRYIYVTDDGQLVRGFNDPEGWFIGYVPHWSTCPAADKFRRK
jgi:hypothetical protein